LEMRMSEDNLGYTPPQPAGRIEIKLKTGETFITNHAGGWNTLDNIRKALDAGQALVVGDFVAPARNVAYAKLTLGPGSYRLGRFRELLPGKGKSDDWRVAEAVQEAKPVPPPVVEPGSIAAKSRWAAFLERLKS
jgi:hypothetical protein